MTDTAWVVVCDNKREYECNDFNIGIASNLDAAYRMAEDHARESHGVLFRRMADIELTPDHQFESEPAVRTPRRKVWLGVAKCDSYEDVGLAKDGSTIPVWYDRDDLYYYAYEWQVTHD